MPLIKSIYWDQRSTGELVKRFGSEEIRLGSVLTVSEGQEAYFFKGGQLFNKFEPGRHVLTTANIPILDKIINLPSGGESTYKASIWFVSKLEKRDMLWGAGGLRIIDPYFQIPIKMAAHGQYGIRIEDGGMLLNKFVGTQTGLDNQRIIDEFRSDVVEAVKASVAKFMKDNNVNINELGSEYISLSKVIADILHKSFAEYGVELLNFNIEDISIDENDKGYQTVMEGIAERARLNHLGVNYMQSKQLDIAQTMAGNEGAGTLMGAGMGVGMGVGMGAGMGNMMGQQVGQVFGQTMNTAQQGLQQAPPPPPSSQFYVAVNGQTTGPFNMQQLMGMAASGNLNANTLVYRMGGSAWVPAAQEPELLQLLNSMTPPPPPPPPAPGM